MPTPSVGILILRDNQVLLVRHEAGSGYLNHIYGLPSGRIKPRETEITAAVRELKEETGLNTTENYLAEFPDNFYVAKLANRKDPSEKEIEFSWRVFFCNKFSGQLIKNPETTPEWVDLQKLSEKQLIVNVKDAIEAGKKYRELQKL